MSKYWLAGFTEAEGSYYLVSLPFGARVPTGPKGGAKQAGVTCSPERGNKFLAPEELVRKEATRIVVNGFSLTLKYDGIVLEAIRSILHISNKVKYNPDYNLYILDTTNSRGIRNIHNYFEGTMKGMKSLSFRL